MIHPVVAQHIPAIRELCQEFGVQKLEIFGSAVTERFDPAHSDVDFIVTYPEGYDVGPWARNHWELQSRLESVLGVSVDLIMSTAIRKPRFERRVRDSRTTLYAA
jgi:predicted nucleotidyltransferase